MTFWAHVRGQERLGSQSTLIVPEHPGPSICQLEYWDPFYPDRRVTQLMTLETYRSFSVAEGRKGILGRGNSMMRVKRFRVQRLRAQLLEPAVLPLNHRMMVGNLPPLLGLSSIPCTMGR